MRTLLDGDVVVIATGSSPNRPADVPFDDESVFDSETILRLPRMPRSMLVLGAGVIGIEYASIFAALGLQVTLVDTRDRLLPYFDREIVDMLERELERLGRRDPPRRPPRRDHAHRRASRRASAAAPSRATCCEADVLLYCVGRDGNTDDLGLEHARPRPATPTGCWRSTSATRPPTPTSTPSAT